MNARYLVVLEQTESGYSAYSPDLPGCVAAGQDRDGTVEEMRAAIQFHLEGMKSEGEAFPQPTCTPAYVEVAV